MQIDPHQMLDWVALPLMGVVAYFAKLTLETDKRLAVMEAHFKSMEDKLDEIRSDVKELMDR